MSITVHASRRSDRPGPVARAASAYCSWPRDAGIAARSRVGRRSPRPCLFAPAAVCLLAVVTFTVVALVTRTDASADGACAPIHWVLNTTGAPPGAKRVVRGAFDSLSAATGMRFVYDGETREEPSATRRNLFGRPVLVAWDGSGRLAWPEDKVAFGYGRWTPGPNGRVFSSGWVYINPDAADARRSLRRTVLHELGHLMGLGHSADPADMMYSNVLPGAAEFSASDRARLTVLAVTAGCPR